MLCEELCQILLIDCLPSPCDITVMLFWTILTNDNVDWGSYNDIWWGVCNWGWSWSIFTSTILNHNYVYLACWGFYFNTGSEVSNWGWSILIWIIPNHDYLDWSKIIFQQRVISSIEDHISTQGERYSIEFMLTWTIPKCVGYVIERQTCESHVCM